jgi:uncharacterized UPF0160 family protein
MIIATHNGKFDADDVFGVALLKHERLFPHAEVWRTRDPDELAQADIRVDVGGRSSPPTDFDHHQLHSSAHTAVGQIAWFYRRELFGSEAIYKRINHRLFKCIEAQDSGTRISVDPHYLYLYSISDVIAAYRPRSSFIRSLRTPQERDVAYGLAFEFALKIAAVIIQSEINLATEWVEGQKTIKRLLNGNSSEILLLPYFIPWHKAVSGAPEIMFVIHPSDDGSTWVIHAVPEGTAFRRSFPVTWMYPDLGTLAEITGIEDAIFCHNSGFMSQTKTKEGAIQLATLALDL